MSYCLVVEDSKIDQRLIASAVGSTLPNLELRFAGDAYQARDLIAQESPLIVLLDLELPVLSGERFLGHLMDSFPLPVIVVTRSVKVIPQRRNVLRQAGASEVIEKPKTLREHAAFSVRVGAAIRQYASNLTATQRSTRVAEIDHFSSTEVDDEAVRLIAIGASTGGPQSLEKILTSLHQSFPPIVIAQHISERFIATLTSRLATSSGHPIYIARDGMSLERDTVYFAPANRHLRVKRDFTVETVASIAEERFTPSVDTMFKSVADIEPTRTIAIVLTGMGNDGAAGAKQLHDAGAWVIAQDEASSVVYGMPRCVVDLGAANEVMALDEIGPAIERRCTTVGLCR